MFAEISTISKSSPTNTALVRFVVQMDLDVVFEVGGGGEGLGTHLTLVAPLARVVQLVPLQASNMGKRLAADVTGVGFDPRMNKHVSLEVAAGREGLGTHGTDVGPLARVDQAVFLQGRHRGKTFATQFTKVRFFSSVLEHVPLQVPGCDERFEADGAGMSLVVQVAQFVAFQAVCLA